MIRCDFLGLKPFTPLLRKSETEMLDNGIIAPSRPGHNGSCDVTWRVQKSVVLVSLEPLNDNPSHFGQHQIIISHMTYICRIESVALQGWVI